jgi:hypothetical protein
MAKVLTSFTVAQQILLEAGLAETRPVQSYSMESEASLRELARQGLFSEVGAGWVLTERGRIVASGLQRQGQEATLLGARS